MMKTSKESNMKTRKLAGNKAAQPGISEMRQSNEASIDFWTKTQRKTIEKPEALIKVIRLRN